MLAAHAVAAMCPRCNRPVRSGIELHTAATELSELLARIAPLGEATDDLELLESIRCLLAHYARELRAELAGSHLNCDATNLDTDLIELALSRASLGAAREARALC